MDKNIKNNQKARWYEDGDAKESISLFKLSI